MTVLTPCHCRMNGVIARFVLSKFMAYNIWADKNPRAELIYVKTSVLLGKLVHRTELICYKQISP